jgi:hypothetical protein
MTNALWRLVLALMGLAMIVGCMVSMWSDEYSKAAVCIGFVILFDRWYEQAKALPDGRVVKTIIEAKDEPKP